MRQHVQNTSRLRCVSALIADPRPTLAQYWTTRTDMITGSAITAGRSSELSMPLCPDCKDYSDLLSRFKKIKFLQKEDSEKDSSEDYKVCDNCGEKF